MANDDFFTKMMFGTNVPNSREEQDGATEDEEAESAQQPDYMHVMNQVGQIMDSIDELKPVFKEIGSMVSAIKNKISM
ncbi:hypothetical protein [Bacillus swezeyi]|uniref:Uncharacterized protein n=1 Tax=Bacillus swezeyi TaxID=1925020 RepID=A0A5M8S0Z0_9BACI|nr:hypothetical protein [Bacillus swezeyi]KAA6453320.1 hypothetical protein DX927_03735 [Bacillus swezeyi]TYS38693.1 hypothetical protein FZC77_03620 [Bacillus swezeyi]